MMIKRLLSAFLSFGIFWSAEGFSQTKIPNLPKDVTAYSQKVETCIHFSGEEPYDKERAAQINQAVKKYCSNIPEQGRGLRLKYKNSPDILKKVDSIIAQYKLAFIKDE